MKLFLRYLQSKLGVLLVFLAFAVILAVSFMLYHLPLEAVLYPAALCALLGILISILWSTPVGSTIVAVDIGAFLIFCLVAKIQGGTAK